ncbi:hypothetical protein HID58_040484, partial [Brassica napus]
ANMSSKLDKAILIGSLGFCFKHSTNEQDSVNYIKEKHAVILITKEDSVSYITKKYCVLFEEAMIKRVFVIMSKINQHLLLYHILIISLIMYLDYIKEKQVELYREDKIKALYEHITTKHTNYQVEAESRCSLKKMMTHENEWSTKDKMKVIQSLSQLELCLVTFHSAEKEKAGGKKTQSGKKNANGKKSRK